jgi:hypothetical protein
MICPPASYQWITLQGHRNWSGPAVSSLGERGPQRNASLIVQLLTSWWGVTAMEAYQWFLLGMMIAWIPGLLALALLLWRSNIYDMGQNSTDNRIL